ncbi:hypothetical protein AB6D11_18695 [Vibrio splendidus]
MICIHCLGALPTTTLSCDSEPLPVCMCPQSVATLTSLSETDTLTIMSLSTLHEAKRIVTPPNFERDPSQHWLDNEENESQLPPSEQARRYFGHRSRTGLMLYWSDWGYDHRGSLGTYEDVWLVVKDSEAHTQPDLIIDTDHEAIEPCLTAAYAFYALQQLQEYAHSLHWNDDVIHSPSWHCQEPRSFDDEHPTEADAPWLTVCRQGLPDWHLTRDDASRITVHKSHLCLDEKTQPISLSFSALQPANTRSLALYDASPWQQCLALLAHCPYVVMEKHGVHGHQMTTLNSDTIVHTGDELCFASNNPYPNIPKSAFELTVNEQSTFHSELTGPSRRASITVTDSDGTVWTLTWFNTTLQALNTPYTGG